MAEDYGLNFSFEPSKGSKVVTCASIIPSFVTEASEPLQVSVRKSAFACPIVLITQGRLRQELAYQWRYLVRVADHEEVTIVDHLEFRVRN